MEEAERRRLVDAHLELAHRAASVIFPRIRQHLEFDEVVAIGHQGLVEAAARFDPSRGVPFGAYAWYRVQGAILDALRRNSNLPRRVWAKLIALRAANEYLEQHGERARGAVASGARPAEGAEALAAIRQALAAIRTMYVTSLEAMREDKGFQPAADAPGPDVGIDSQRLAARLRAALERLPEKERTLVTKHYFEGKNLMEAGNELGISKSWASRLHAQAVDRLRGYLEEADG